MVKQIETQKFNQEVERNKCLLLSFITQEYLKKELLKHTAETSQDKNLEAKKRNIVF